MHPLLWSQSETLALKHLRMVIGPFKNKTYITIEKKNPVCFILLKNIFHKLLSGFGLRCKIHLKSSKLSSLKKNFFFYFNRERESSSMVSFY